MKYNAKLTKTNFYDSYHKKNHSFFRTIDRNNFTYFYILRALDYILSRGKYTFALDIGCGVGTLGFYLWNKGLKVDGFDVSARAIAIANEYKELGRISGINFTNADVMKEKFKPKYNLVICTEVIEHLEDDKKMLSTIHNSLSEGGYLLLSTPSLNAPLYRLGFLRSFDKEVGHLRRYTPERLERLFIDSGFKIEKVYLVEGLLRNSLFTLPLVGKLIRLIKGPLVPLFHAIDSASAALFGESDIIVVARKV